MSGKIADLPVEIIDMILGYLDKPPLIEQRLYDNPAKILDDDTTPANGSCPFSCPSSCTCFTTSTLGAPNKAGPIGANDLKSASLVSRTWRDCAMPLLFRHVLWKFQSFQRPRTDQDALADVDELEWLRFLRRNELLKCVETLSIVIDYPSTQIGEDPTHHQEFGILPSHLVVPKRKNQPVPASRGNNWLWRTIFDHIDPKTITLISSPAILASLLGRPIDLSGSWLFRQRFHILSLSRSSPLSSHDSHDFEPTKREKPPHEAVPSSKASPQSIPCNLFDIREWKSLFINEGSSVRAYATYQYYSHTPPSLLPALLDSSDPSMTKMLSSLANFSYIAMFPFSNHLASHLVPRVPSLHRFYIQIVPRKLNFAEEPYRRPAIDINDFWVERNSAYSHLAMAIFDGQPTGAWKDLKVFESGDSADLEAWETAVQFVVFNAGTRWQVSGNGKFTRRTREIIPPPVADPFALAMSTVSFDDDHSEGSGS